MNKKRIICLITLIMFLILLIIILKTDELKIDNYIINIFQSKNNIFTNIMKVITFLGSATCIITLTIILLLTIKNKQIKILIASNLIISTLLNQILKYAVQRPRPENPIIKETGFSFPSGHSMVSLTFYGLLIYLIIKSNMKYKKLYITVLLIIIPLIGISRIYLGVHYPTDVLGGFLISTSYLIILIEITKPLQTKIKTIDNK